MSVQSKMTAIANPIRTLSGASGALTLDQMAQKLTAANGDVASALSALADKGVDTTGAGLADIAALVAGIQAGGAPPNGKEWTRTNENNAFYGIGYADGLWIGGHTTGILYSADAITWTQSNVTGTNVRCVKKIGGTWFCGTDAALYKSADGKTWTACGLTQRVYDIEYAKGVLVASCFIGMYYSTDFGSSWTAFNSAYIGSEHKIVYAPGLDVWVIANNKGIFRSTDGINWNNINSYDCLRMEYGNGLFVVCIASAFYYSTDGSTWTKASAATGASDICYGAGLWVAVNNSSGILYSTDGKTWTRGNNRNKLRSVAYGNGMWVCTHVTSEANGLKYSQDGINWMESNITSGSIPRVLWGDGIWCTGQYYSKSFS